MSLPNGVGGADRLAAALAQLRERSAPATPAAAPTPLPPPPPPPGPSRFAQHMGARLARMFDAVTDSAIEKFRRKPGEVDETDLNDFEDAAALIIQRWIPDAELGPYGKLAMSAVFMCGGKWVGGEPITLPSRAAVPAAAMNTTPAAAAPTNTTPVASAAPPLSVAPDQPPSAVGGF